MNSTSPISDLTGALTLTNPDLDLPSHSGQFAYIVTKPNLPAEEGLLSRLFNRSKKPKKTEEMPQGKLTFVSKITIQPGMFTFRARRLSKNEESDYSCQISQNCLTPLVDSHNSEQVLSIHSFLEPKQFVSKLRSFLLPVIPPTVLQIIVIDFLVEFKFQGEMSDFRAESPTLELGSRINMMSPLSDVEMESDGETVEEEEPDAAASDLDDPCEPQSPQEID